MLTRVHFGVNINRVVEVKIRVEVAGGRVGKFGGVAENQGWPKTICLSLPCYPTLDHVAIHSHIHTYLRCLVQKPQ
jgi:hypothetical protein